MMSILIDCTKNQLAVRLAPLALTWVVTTIKGLLFVPNFGFS